MRSTGAAFTLKLPKLRAPLNRSLSDQFHSRLPPWGRPLVFLGPLINVLSLHVNIGAHR